MASKSLPMNAPRLSWLPLNLVPCGGGHRIRCATSHGNRNCSSCMCSGFAGRGIGPWKYKYSILFLFHHAHPDSGNYRGISFSFSSLLPMSKRASASAKVRDHSQRKLSSARIMQKRRQRGKTDDQERESAWRLHEFSHSLQHFSPALGSYMRPKARSLHLRIQHPAPTTHNQRRDLEF